MKRLGDILDMPLPMIDDDVEMKDLVAIAKLHLTAADTALKVQVRVDDARLRRQNTDLIPEIEKILQAEKVKMARIQTIEAEP